MSESLDFFITHYRLIYGDLVIECASVEDVVALAPQLTGALSNKAKPTQQASSTPSFSPTTPISRWNERRIKEYYGMLEARQRQVIDALFDNDGRTQRQLMEVTGLNSGAKLAGVMSALVRNAKKVAVDPTDVYTKQPVAFGDEGYDYRLSDGLRQALQLLKNGHPEGIGAR